MRGPRRVIDPEAPAIAIKEQRLGVVSSRTMRRDQQTANRYLEKSKPRIMTLPLGPFFRENVPASAPTGANVRSILPSDATTFATTNQGLLTTIFDAGRVVGAHVRSSSSVTAGSLTAAVEVGGTLHLMSDCVLSTATNQTNMLVPIPWEYGIPFAAGEVIKAMLVTDASFAPTTLEVIITLYLAFEV